MAKKRIFLLGLLTIASCVGAVCVSKAQGQSQQPKPAWATNDPNFASGNAAETADVLKKLVWSIVAVVIIGTAAIWALKKWPKLVAVRGKQIKVVETVQLAPHRAVHIIEVGTQKFLIGSSSESVRMLADVTLALESETPSEPQK